jgi:hypothetical protein
LTIHPSADNYLSHTQAKKHQTNMRRRAAREQKLNAFDGSSAAASSLANKVREEREETDQVVLFCFRYPFFFFFFFFRLLQLLRLEKLRFTKLEDPDIE